MTSILLIFCWMSLIAFSIMVIREVIEDVRSQLRIKHQFSTLDSTTEPPSQGLYERV